MFGLFEAVKAGSGDVLVTAKYTDKSSYAPDNYLTSVLYDFSGPLTEIVSKTMEGETGGYYPLGFDTGVSLQMPLANASPEVNEKVEQIIKDLEEGKIEVVKDTSPIE